MEERPLLFDTVVFDEFGAALDSAPASVAGLKDLLAREAIFAD